MEGNKFMVKNKTFKETYEDSIAYGENLVWVSEQTGLGYRQVLRKVEAIKNGTYSETHGLTGKKANRKSKVDKIAVIKEYLDMGKKINEGFKVFIPNFSFYTFHKKYLSKTHNISLGTFKLIMNEANIPAPNATKATIKRYKKIVALQSKNPIISECVKLTDDQKNEIDLQIKEVIDQSYKIKPRKARPTSLGYEIQIDACNDYWIGDKKCHVYIAKDISANKVISIYYEKEETTHGYYILLKYVIENYGIPRTIKADQRSSFIVNAKKHCIPEREALTQFGFVCQLLKINLEVSSVPEFKGSVERHFRTMQALLRQVMRLDGITTVDEANSRSGEYMKLLNDEYADNVELQSVYRKYNLDLSLEHLFSIRDFRMIDKGGAVSFGNVLYLPWKDDKLIMFKERTRILIERTLDGKLFGSVSLERFEMRKITYDELTRGQKYNYDHNKIVRPSYSVADEHPWSYMSFIVYLEKIQKKEHYVKGL